MLLITYVVMALAYNAVTPSFEAPDEHTHFFFAQHLAYGGSLPVQPLDRSLRGPWEQEGSQPPLYHALIAPWIRLVGAHLDADDLWYNDQNTMGDPNRLGNENRFVHPPAREAWPWHGVALALHLTRLVSTLLGLFTVIAVWSLAGRVFNGLGRRQVTGSALPLAAAALTAFNPQFLAMSSAVSNDSLIVALAAVTLALLARVADGDDSAPTIGGLMLAAGLAPLAKLSGLMLLAFAALTLLVLGSRRSQAGPANLGPAVRSLRPDSVGPRRAALVVLMAIVLSGWWYLRNWQLYGDLLGTSRMLVTHGRAFRLDRWLAGLPDELVGVWYSSWGLFGWFTILMPQAIYRVISLAAVLGLIGLARLAAGLAGRPAGEASRQPENARRRAETADGLGPEAAPRDDSASPAGGALSWVRPRRLAWLFAWGALVFASLLRWLMLAKGGQGRLVFPALPFFAIALVAGWRALLPRRASDRALAAGVAGLMLALSIYALVGVIGPAYASASSVPATDVPTSALKADAVFERRLRLVAAAVPERIAEGQVFQMTLYWQATAPITREGYVAVRFDQSVAAGAEVARALPSTAGEPKSMASPPPVEGAADLEAAAALRIESSQAQLSYLAGGNTPPSLLVPGDRVYVDRRWVEAPALASPALVHGVVVSAEGPAAGRPPPDAERLPAPVAARLSVHLYDQTRAERWPLEVDGGDEASSEWATSIVIVPQSRGGGLGARPPIPSGYEVAARFGNGLVLWRPTGVAGMGTPGAPDGNSAPAGGASGGPDGAPGDPDQALIELPVIWQAERDVAADLSAFVHVVDAAGRPLGAFDGPPANLATFPTSRWRRGDLIPAVLRWRRPADEAPYGVRVGLYRTSDGARVSAMGPQGAAWPDDAVDLLRAASP